MRTGKMPPWFYSAVHPASQMAPAEVQALLQGLEETLGTGGGKRARKGHGD